MSHLIAEEVTKANKKVKKDNTLDILFNAADIDVPYKMKQYINVIENMNKNREIDSAYDAITRGINDTITNIIEGNVPVVEQPRGAPAPLMEKEVDVVRSRVEVDVTQDRNKRDTLEKQKEVMEKEHEKEEEVKERKIEGLIGDMSDPGQARSIEDDVGDIEAKVENVLAEESIREQAEEKIDKGVGNIALTKIDKNLLKGPHARYIFDPANSVQWSDEKSTEVMIRGTTYDNIVGLALVKVDSGKAKGTNRLLLRRKKKKGDGYSNIANEDLNIDVEQMGIIKSRIEKGLLNSDTLQDNLDNIMSDPISDLMKGSNVIPTDGVLIIDNLEDAQDQLLKYMGSVVSGNGNDSLLNYISTIAQWLWTNDHITLDRYNELLEFISTNRARALIQ